MDEETLTAAQQEEEVQSDGTTTDADSTETTEVDETSDLETLILAEVPDAYDSLTPVLASAGTFLVAGVLIAFLFWTIGYAVHSSYRLLDDSSK